MWSVQLIKREAELSMLEILYLLSCYPSKAKVTVYRMKCAAVHLSSKDSKMKNPFFGTVWQKFQGNKNYLLETSGVLGGFFVWLVGFVQVCVFYGFVWLFVLSICLLFFFLGCNILFHVTLYWPWVCSAMPKRCKLWHSREPKKH